MRIGGIETLKTEIQATAKKNADLRKEIIEEYLKTRENQLLPFQSLEQDV